MTELTFATDSQLKALTCPDGRPFVEAADRDNPGLSVRIRPSGTKTFYARYRFEGRQRRIKLGQYPLTALSVARVAARKLRTAQHERKSWAEVQPGRKNDVLTLDRLFARFEAERTLKRPDFHQHKYMKHIQPKLGEKPISEITRDDCRAVIRAVGESGHHAAANHVHSVLSALFTFAVEDLNVLDLHPIKGMRKLFPMPPSRDRVLSDDELKAFLSALFRQPPTLCSEAIKLCILTLQRRGEVAGMRWRELDLDEQVWTLPPSLTKNGKRHRIPVSKPAMEVVENARRFGGDVFVFPSATSASIQSVAPHSMSRYLNRLANRVGISDFRLHDLRRTASTMIVRQNPVYNDQILAHILNHSSTKYSVTMIYNRHDYIELMRKCLDDWARTVHMLADH